MTPSAIPPGGSITPPSIPPGGSVTPAAAPPGATFTPGAVLPGTTRPGGGSSGTYTPGASLPGAPARPGVEPSATLTPAASPPGAPVNPVVDPAGTFTPMATPPGAPVGPGAEPSGTFTPGARPPAGAANPPPAPGGTFTPSGLPPGTSSTPGAVPPGSMSPVGAPSAALPPPLPNHPRLQLTWPQLAATLANGASPLVPERWQQLDDHSLVLLRSSGQVLLKPAGQGEVLMFSPLEGTAQARAAGSRPSGGESSWAEWYGSFLGSRYETKRLRMESPAGLRDRLICRVLGEPAEESFQIPSPPTVAA